MIRVIFSFLRLETQTAIVFISQRRRQINSKNFFQDDHTRRSNVQRRKYIPRPEMIPKLDRK